MIKKVRLVPGSERKEKDKKKAPPQNGKSLPSSLQMSSTALINEVMRRVEGMQEAQVQEEKKARDFKLKGLLNAKKQMDTMSSQV